MNKIAKDDLSRDAYHEHLKVFGDAWMLIIVSELLDAPCRFNELQRRACGISPVTLTVKLKKLEQLGIVVREAKTKDQLSVSYHLTDKGRALEPALRAIQHFGVQHFDVPECEQECKKCTD